MNQQLNVDVYSATIARMDNGQVYASLMVGQKVIDEKAENAKGLQLMKISCNEDVYNAISLQQVPAPHQLTVALKKGAGGKMSTHCVSCQTVQNRPAQAQPSKS